MRIEAGGSSAAFPIIVGTTGHRQIAAADREQVAHSVRVVLTGLQAACGDALHVMSGLALGADQIVAGIADELGIKLITTLPMKRALYRTEMTTPAASEVLDRLWAASVLRLELPMLAEPGAAGLAEQQYVQLGQLLARRCHLLLALWDGVEDDGEGSGAPPVGGTADVVHMRLDGARWHGRTPPGPLFAGSASRLDLVPCGPVLHLMTPRPESAATGVAGACRLLQLDGAGQLVVRAVDPAHVFAGLDPAARKDLLQIIALNRTAARRAAAAPAGLPELVAADPDHDPGPVGAYLDQLCRWQHAADLAAQSFQRKLFGDWVPARSAGAMWRQVWTTLRRTGRLRNPGALFVFAAAVPIAVAGFEIYSEFGQRYWALLLYLGTFGGAMALYQFHVRRHQWQNCYQDYRALAEAMRVQVFWALSAIPVGAADIYLRKQSGEMGWIPLALRGPALWAAALALALPRPKRAMVVRCWIEHQRQFFLGAAGLPGRAALNRHAAANGDRWARRFLVAGLVMAASLGVLETARRVSGVAPHAASHELTLLRDMLLFFAATCPALAGFFTISVEKRAYEAHADTYELMGRIFERALRALRTPELRENDAAWQSLVLDLGREALSENAEWLLDHRHRPIESKAS